MLEQVSVIAIAALWGGPAAVGLEGAVRVLFHGGRGMGWMKKCRTEIRVVWMRSADEVVAAVAAAAVEHMKKRLLAFADQTVDRSDRILPRAGSSSLQ